MDLALSEIQQMLKTSAREVLAQECPFEVVRAMEGHPQGYPPELWRGMSELGWLGLAAPEEYGGAGGSFLDLAMLLEEMGRALTPGPFFSTVVLGALTVMDAGDEAMRSKLLPGISSGETLMTLAVTEESGGYGPEGVQLEAKRRGDEYVLSGRKLFVPDAHVADYAIVAARTSEGTDAREGITLFLTPLKTEGVVVTPHATMALGEAGAGGFQRRSGACRFDLGRWMRAGRRWSEPCSGRRRPRGWRWWGARKRCWI